MRMRRGFTLLEVAIALAIFSLAFSLLFILLEESSNSLEYFSTAGIIDNVIMRALDSVTDDMRQASQTLPTGVPGRIVVVAGTHDDRLSVVFAQGEGEIARVEYAVDGNRQLIRTTTQYILDASGVPVRKTDGAGNILPPVTRIMALHVDTTDNTGHKGFAVAQAAGAELYTVGLRLRAEGAGGEVMRRDYSTAASVRS